MKFDTDIHARRQRLHYLELIAYLCVNIETYQDWVVKSGFSKVNEHLRQCCRE